MVDVVCFFVLFDDGEWKYVVVCVCGEDLFFVDWCDGNVCFCLFCLEFVDCVDDFDLYGVVFCVLYCEVCC